MRKPGYDYPPPVDVKHWIGLKLDRLWSKAPPLLVILSIFCTLLTLGIATSAVYLWVHGRQHHQPIVKKSCNPAEHRGGNICQ